MATQEQVEKAIADPTKKFKSPMDVVNDPQLDAQQKRAILESWKKDAELLSTASDENMSGGEAPQLQDVSLALDTLKRLSGRTQ
jgi:hypothetical protein